MLGSTLASGRDRHWPETGTCSTRSGCSGCWSARAPALRDTESRAKKSRYEISWYLLESDTIAPAFDVIAVAVSRRDFLKAALPCPPVEPRGGPTRQSREAALLLLVAEPARDLGIGRVDVHGLGDGFEADTRLHSQRELVDEIAGALGDDRRAEDTIGALRDQHLREAGLFAVN